MMENASLSRGGGAAVAVTVTVTVTVSRDVCPLGTAGVRRSAAVKKGKWKNAALQEKWKNEARL